MLKYRQLLHSALVLSLAVLFWSAQILPALAGPVLGGCEMKEAGCAREAHQHQGGCCCGSATHDALKGRCCDLREAEGNPHPDLAVNPVPNLPNAKPVGLVAESCYSKDLDPCIATTGTVDWVQSKSLSKPIYLNNVNFLC